MRVLCSAASTAPSHVLSASPRLGGGLRGCDAVAPARHIDVTGLSGRGVDVTKNQE